MSEQNATPATPLDDATQVVPGMAIPKSRLAYILLAIFLGYLGVHNFYAGFTKKGIIQLILSVLVITAFITFIWVIIDIITVTEDANGNQFS